MGPQVGTVVAIAEIIKLIVTNCVLAMGATNYIIESTGLQEVAQYPMWIAMYTVFTLIDILGMLLALFKMTCG